MAKRAAIANAPKSTLKDAGPQSKRRWSAKVDTDATHPEHGLFLKSPEIIAKQLATKKVSPKGPASGMRMLTFYMNRAGKNLTPDRVAALEEAKEILSGIIAKHNENVSTKKPAATKAVGRKSLAKKSRTKTANKVVKKTV